MGRKAVALSLVATAAALALVGVAGPWGDGTGSSDGATTVAGARPAEKGVADELDAAIAAAQTRLRTVPQDDVTWAALGSAYVQQARITGDPTYYPKAQGALERSIELEPTDNTPAFVGMGALANARHEFAAALDWGRRAQNTNAYAASAYGVLDDALTQLGRYDEAQAAAQEMLDLEPGVSSFARASYHFEETGKADQAQKALLQALDDANSPSDRAFCLFYLGELAFNEGDAKQALARYDEALAADPSYDATLAGRAKALAALGRTDEALAFYASVTQRVPLPQYVQEYGELLQSLGRTEEAEAQFVLLEAEQKLFAANGVTDELLTAVYEADHGDPETAVRAAHREWNQRRSVLVADALAWALHKAGRDAEARPYATYAAKLGWRNATFLYHRGMIELSLGDKVQARRYLTAALGVNPHFSPLYAPAARKTLATLGGAA